MGPSQEPSVPRCASDWACDMTDTYDVTAHLPAGVILTSETDRALMDAWAANNGEPLSAGQITAIVGPAQPPVSIARSWPTGDFPTGWRKQP